jgi:tRNA A-37 threonylcarbamoyl transferase component Bud32
MTDEVQEQDREVGLKTGDLLAGRFEIQKMLAEGGMGRVYVAIQQPMGRKVAVKVMKQELVSDQASVKRFFREAVAVSKLSHPNTITIIDYGEGEGKNLYIAMEYLEGEPLSEIMIRAGAMPLARVVNIIGQVARSLVEAHRKGVIHRDLKPENVFISNVEAGVDLVKVLDFGIAKLQQSEGTKITRLGYVCGTPEYMSPEQARGEEIDGRTDVYALGIVMWEMLEGRVPFFAPTPLGIVLKHQSDPIPLLTADVPQPFKNFVYRVMSKDPGQRPPSADAFLEELLASVPDDLATYSISTGTSTAQRRSVGPDTPLRVRETGDIANAATMADGHAAFSTANVAAIPPSPLPKVLLAAAAAVFLLGLVGLAAILLSPKSPDADATVGVGHRSGPGDDEAGAEAPMLQIDGNPSEAEIFEDGKMVGLAPTQITGEPGEKRTLEIKKAGYKSSVLVQTLPDSGALRVLYALNEEVAAEKVKITLETEPSGAAIRRGGSFVAKTPYIFELDATEDSFEVQLEMNKYATQKVELDPKTGSQTFKLPLTRATAPRNPTADKRTPAETKGEVAPPDKRSPPVTKPAEDNKTKPENKYKLVH